MPSASRALPPWLSGSEATYTHRLGSARGHARQFGAAHCAGRDAHVVAGKETDVLASREHGVNAYVVKPLAFDKFVSAIGKLGTF